MSFFQSFIVARLTEPDPATLLAQLRALDATAGVQHAPATSAYVIKKATAWTAPHIAAAQNVLETAPASTPQLTAHAVIAAWPIETRALLFMILKQINIIRAALPVPLPPITPAQAVAAIVNEADGQQ